MRDADSPSAPRCTRCSALHCVHGAAKESNLPARSDAPQWSGQPPWQAIRCPQVLQVTSEVLTSGTRFVTRSRR
jgi:hypothetical protein